MPTDPTASVRLYSWSSEEFREEHALVYTSRSKPSQTCVSHWRWNHDEVLFTLQDCLSIGNPVIIDFEIQTEKDQRGFHKISSFGFHDRSGKFTEKTNEPELCIRRYRDTYRLREGKLEACPPMESDDDNEGYLEFTTGLVGGPGLIYTINIHCHPLKGIDVELDGPECYFGDPSEENSIIGLCSVKCVGGMPPSNVLLEQDNRYLKHLINELEEDKGNNYIDDGPSRGASSSSSSSTQTTNAFMNSGYTLGALNGVTFNGCNFDFGRLIEAIKQRRRSK